MDKEQYEKGLAQRQIHHLAALNKKEKDNWKPCKHNECLDCIGTYIKHNGTTCVHHLVCDCPKCKP